MNDLNEIQDIWKTGTNSNSVKTIPGNSLPNSMIQKLKKLESLQSRINKLKILVLLFLFGMIGYSISTLSDINYPVYIGFGIVMMAAICFMAIYLKNQFNIKKLDFTTDALKFAESAIEMLKGQNSIFRLPFTIFALLLVLGTNVMLLGVDLSTQDPYKIHINISFIIVVSALIGLRIRLWRIKKEIDPLITELNDFKESLLKP
jgi:hypothetical protein